MSLIPLNKTQPLCTAEILPPPGHLTLPPLANPMPISLPNVAIHTTQGWWLFLQARLFLFQDLPPLYAFIILSFFSFVFCSFFSGHFPAYTHFVLSSLRSTSLWASLLSSFPSSYLTLRSFPPFLFSSEPSSSLNSSCFHTYLFCHLWAQGET